MSFDEYFHFLKFSIKNERLSGKLNGVDEYFHFSIKNLQFFREIETGKKNDTI